MTLSEVVRPLMNHCGNYYYFASASGPAACCCPATSIMPEQLDLFVERVIPELRRPGLFRDEYEFATLREDLGLDVI